MGHGSATGGTSLNEWILRLVSLLFMIELFIRGSIALPIHSVVPKAVKN